MTGTELKGKVIKTAFFFLFAVLVLIALYFTIALNWSYSKGDRIGYVQKFSEKGWLFKTWEGELQMLPVPGVVPEKFLFTVHEKATIDKLNKSMGKKVAISYEQHKGLPTTCFGESEYFAVDVKVAE